MAFTKQKLGVCIKIDDGKMLPQYNVAQLMIALSNLFAQEKLQPLEKYAQHELKNFNQLVTGEMRVNTEIFRHWIALWDELNSPINEA
jgi:L-asparaginase II